MMKRILLFSAALLLTLSLKAEITPTSSQMWWGYFTASDDVTYLSTGSTETFHCAIYVPANHDFVGGSTIKGIRFYLNSKTLITMCKVWVSKTLPASADDADYVQNVSTSQLTSGANDIALTTPYVVNNEGIYIGYSFTSKLSLSARVACGGTGFTNAFLIKTSSTIPEWNSLTSYGKLALQILLDGGTYPENNASPDDFGPVLLKPGESKSVPVNITNYGMSPITSISYTVTTDGTTSGEETVSLTALPYLAHTKIPITLEGADSEETTTTTLTITKVNGNANTSDSPSATGRVVTASDILSWPRNVLIEEFTTESCGYCPDAAAGLASFMTTYPDLASRTAVACHHAGYYTDWLTIPASDSYTWLYNSSGTYAPAFMYDRHVFQDNSAVESRQSNAAGYKARVDARIATPSYANIDLTATFNGDNSSISVTADCQRSWDFSNTPQRITLFLTEDNITAKSQSGASGTFVHQHVLRAVNETWGSILDWTDNSATYSYTFTVSSSWKTSSLKVIALISSYNDSDANDCVVENAAEVNLGASPTAVTTVSTTDSTPVARYTPDGRHVTTPQRGLSIVKTADGRTRKVISR